MALAYGSRGDDVLAYQQKMKAAGFDPGPLDGIWGDKTEAANKAYSAGMTAATSSLASPAPDPTAGLVGLRSAAERAGGTVTWDPTKGAMVNGATIDTSRMQNIGNKWYGTAEDVYGQLATTKAPDYQTGGGMFSQDDMTGLIQRILNPGAFSIDETNPMIAAMRTQATKTGDKAFSDNIADLTAGTGGQLSSWAASQASGARSNAMQDADSAIAQLAYSMWQDGQQQDLSRLSALMGVDETMYGRSRDAYGDFRNAAGTGLDLANTQYERGIDNRDYSRGVYESDRAFTQDKLNADRNYALNVRQENRMASSGSGTSDGNDDITKLGSTDQVSAYYDFLDIFSGGGNGTYKGDPAAAYTRLVGNRGQIEKMVGTKLYNRLLSDIKGLDTVVGQQKPETPEESTPMVSSPYYDAAQSKVKALQSATVTDSKTRQQLPKYTDEQIASEMETWIRNQPISPQEMADLANALGL